MKTARLFTLACLAGLAVVSFSCERSSTHATAATQAKASEQSYTVRGKVVQLPTPGSSREMLQIHHEAIPTFVNREGKAVGMNEMVMPFSTRDGVSLDGLAVGDAVEFVLVVDWSKAPAYAITSIARLPAGTTLNIRP